MGLLQDENIEKIAKKLYQERSWRGNGFYVRFVCFKAYENEKLHKQYPLVQQMLHENMMNFIYERLTTYYNALHRENWDTFIQRYVELIELDLGPDKLLAWTLLKEI